ncbi:transcriptional regulator GcvA [Alteromonas oceanisediminis]|uniref:transcriptional regulator GcvA n=1 Tax=Alteromonas oceanisediminis TaxID=2836180 RepID=UPI001BDAB9EF|nr:transcriptional regulator GcvA [Alteromonas oceanisediminis]MBT0587317.1 transcriptional regulator GcvA [Alteromonas oceanisediminis]
MQRRLPPLNALKAFEAAARYLSFTRAAEELFVTQAAVSHQIKSLEDFLGMRLFLRKNRALLLTEEGQSYYLELRDIFRHLLDSTERLLAKGAKGALTVATPPSFASQWLIPRISRFSASNPDIDVKLKAVDHDEGFLQADTDVAVYYGRGRWTGLHSDPLHAEYLTPLCSPIVLTGDKPMEVLEDLKFHILLHDSSREGWSSYLKHFGVKGVNVNQGPMFSHSMMVLQAAALGQGIALGNTVLARPEIDAGRLVIPFAEKIKSKHSFYLVCEEGQAELGKIAAFRQWMINEVKAENDAVL